MRLAHLNNSLIVGLALAVALPATGCVDDAATEDGVVEEDLGEVGPGDVVGAATSAMQIVKMFNNYQKYGEVEVSTGEILDQVKQVQAQLDVLKAAMSQLNDAVTATHKDVLGVGAVQTLNSIDSLWQAFRTVKATNDDAKVQAFLASISSNTASAGSLRWSDLATLSDILAGANILDSLLDLVAQDSAARGLAASVDDTLGSFAIHARLVQEQGFFLLALADANNPSIDIEQRKVEHVAHIEAQTNALRGATATFNARVAATGAATRTSEIGDCTCVDDGRPFICQAVPPFVTPPFYRVDDPEGGGTGGRGLEACQAARTVYVEQVSKDFQASLATKLWTNANGFQLWMDERATSIVGIRVLGASYSDGIVANTVTGPLAFPCDGLTSCAYTIRKTVLGNPNSDAQGFFASYRCDDMDRGNPRAFEGAKTIRIPAEADGQTVTLSCPAVAGDVAKVVGTYQDPTPTPDGSTNPWQTTTITRLSSQVLLWTNAAGVSWTLSLTGDPGKLAVSPSTTRTITTPATPPPTSPPTPPAPSPGSPGPTARASRASRTSVPPGPY